MTLIDGDRIITAQLYDDEHEEFTEKRMSIIEYINAYTDEGVTTADDMLDKIRAEIESIENYATDNGHDIWLRTPDEIKKEVLAILDKYDALPQPKVDALDSLRYAVNIIERRKGVVV